MQVGAAETAAAAAPVEDTIAEEPEEEAAATAEEPAAEAEVEVSRCLMRLSYNLTLHRPRRYLFVPIVLLSLSAFISSLSYCVV